MKATAMKRMLVGFFLAALCVFAPTSALPQNERAPNSDLPGQSGLRESGGDILNSRGQKIPPNKSGGEEASDSTSTESDGVDVFFPPNQGKDKYDLGIESHAGCTLWWIYGYDSWRYTSYYFYVRATFYSSSRTTYATSTGSCGEALYVDRLYLKATEYPLNTGYYGEFDKTGYNINFIDREDKRYLYGNGPPTPCGIRGYHEAYHRGVRWSVTVRVGCA